MFLCNIFDFKILFIAIFKPVNKLLQLAPFIKEVVYVILQSINILVKHILDLS